MNNHPHSQSIRNAAKLLALASLLATVSLAQDSKVKSDGSLLWDSCGGQDQPACAPNSPAYNYIATFAPVKCDFTLDLSFETGLGWMCRDRGRRKSIPDAAHTQSKAPISQAVFFQQSDQLNRISADLPLNYVPIIGTHNSYSNVYDGGANAMNLDQVLTITDQLQMGARHIRLDPMPKVQNQTPILCHMSPIGDGMSKFLKAFNLPSSAAEFCNTALFGAAMSYQRPFFYAVRELNKWLDQHPGEVVILRLQFIPGSGTMVYDITDILIHELPGKLMEKQEGGRVPTLREIRAAGKQVVVLSNKNHFENTPKFILNAAEVKDAQDKLVFDWTNSTAHPLYPQCLSETGNPIGINRAYAFAGDPIWPHVGEDRSASMAYESALNQGLLGAVETETAVYCGYSMLGFDFFHALQYAPKSSIAMPGAGTFDFSGPSPDPRPQAAIWSWRTGTVLSTPQPAAITKPPVTILAYPARLTDYRNIRWESVSEQTALPFACADTASPENPRRYAWRITTATGPWSAGETECQKLSPSLHFWHPMSSIENEQLTEVFKGVVAQKVWLNHFSGRTVALPSAVNLNATGTANIVMSSGIGGGFRLSFIPSGGAPNFLDVPSTTSSPIIQLKANNAIANSLPAGVYKGTVLIEESVGYLKNTTQVMVTLVK